MKNLKKSLRDFLSKESEPHLFPDKQKYLLFRLLHEKLKHFDLKPGSLSFYLCKLNYLLEYKYKYFHLSHIK